MWKCLKCGIEYADTVVQCACGYDESKNYIKYLVFSRILEEELKEASENLTVNDNKKHWMNWIHTIGAEVNELEEKDSKELLANMKKVFASYLAKKKHSHHFDASFLLGANADHSKCDSKTKSRWMELDFEPEEALKYTLEGNCWYFGIGRECNYFQAVLSYQKADEMFHLDATNNLGNCFFYGKGVSKDYNAAIECYKKAANNEHMAALYNLAYCYEYGYGVEKDIDLAVTYYIRAAKQGLLKAQRRLGEYYLNQDIDKAIYWYEKAIEAGDVQSKMFLSLIQKVEKSKS